MAWTYPESEAEYFEKTLDSEQASQSRVDVTRHIFVLIDFGTFVRRIALQVWE